MPQLHVHARQKKKLERQKAKEDLSGSCAPAGGPVDTAETLPMSDTCMFDSQPDESQRPPQEVQDSQPVAEAAYEVGCGAEGSSGEQAEEEMGTDDEVVEPIVCHEQVAHMEYEETQEETHPKEDHNDKGSKIEEEQVKTSKTSKTVSAASSAKAEGVPMAPPQSPQTVTVDSDDDTRPKKKSGKGEAEDTKGTFKDRYWWIFGDRSLTFHPQKPYITYNWSIKHFRSSQFSLLSTWDTR